MADDKDKKGPKVKSAKDLRRAKRRILKGTIAAAKRDESVKKLPKSARVRAAGKLGRKLFREEFKKREAAKAAAAAKKAEAPAAPQA